MAFGHSHPLVSYIITTVCMSVRPTIVPRFNGPVESARTVGFRNLWQLGSYKNKKKSQQGGWGGAREEVFRASRGEGGPRRVFFFPP
jgi:hypothetical protein